MATRKTDWENSGVPLAVCQFKIVLLGTRPPIWRRVVVPADFTLAELHHVIQTAMGWEDDHLHEFLVGGLRFGVPDPNEALMGGPPCMDEEDARVADVLSKRGPKPKYIYDFGDCWEHALNLEKREILVPMRGVTYPICADGKRNCPPEDCGGIPGFYHKLEALADPNHEEHEELREWMGDFDPETFSIEVVNQKLHKMFRVSHRRKPVETAQPKSPTANIETLCALLEAVQPRLQLPHKQPQRIRPDEKVPLELNDRERTLILEHTFAHEELTNRLRIAPKPGERPVFRFTLDDLDDLAEFVAAEANHAKDKKLGKELDRLFARIDHVLESYTDQD
jgi:hypothetical protein